MRILINALTLACFFLLYGPILQKLVFADCIRIPVSPADKGSTKVQDKVAFVLQGRRHS